jgi:hypothetical protein
MTQKRFPTGIMSTVCVPWDERGQAIESLLRKNVRQALACTRHLYLVGTAGEGYALTDAQFTVIVRSFADEMRSSGTATPGSVKGGPVRIRAILSCSGRAGVNRDHARAANSKVRGRDRICHVIEGTRRHLAVLAWEARPAS